jgi:hypothetical protein
MTSANALVASAAKLAGAPGATIKSFLTGLASLDAAQVTSDVVIPKAPMLTGDVEDALAALPSALAAVQLPDTRRALTEAEEKSIADLLRVVKTINSTTKAILEDGLRPALFNHADVLQESARQVDGNTPKDGNGFYLTPAKGVGWKRTVRSGTLAADAEKLAELDALGEIEHADYLAATRPTRVIDEAGFLKLVARKPGLLPKLRQAVKFSRGSSVSLTLD